MSNLKVGNPKLSHLRLKCLNIFLTIFIASVFLPKSLAKYQLYFVVNEKLIYAPKDNSVTHSYAKAISQKTRKAMLARLGVDVINSILKFGHARLMLVGYDSVEIFHTSAPDAVLYDRIDSQSDPKSIDDLTALMNHDGITVIDSQEVSEKEVILLRNLVETFKLHERKWYGLKNCTTFALMIYAAMLDSKNANSIFDSTGLSKDSSRYHLEKKARDIVGYPYKLKSNDSYNFWDGWNTLLNRVPGPRNAVLWLKKINEDAGEKFSNPSKAACTHNSCIYLSGDNGSIQSAALNHDTNKAFIELVVSFDLEGADKDVMKSLAKDTKIIFTNKKIKKSFTLDLTQNSDLVSIYPNIDLNQIIDAYSPRKVRQKVDFLNDGAFVKITTEFEGEDLAKLKQEGFSISLKTQGDHLNGLKILYSEIVQETIGKSPKPEWLAKIQLAMNQKILVHKRGFTKKSADRIAQKQGISAYLRLNLAMMGLTVLGTLPFFIGEYQDMKFEQKFGLDPKRHLTYNSCTHENGNKLCIPANDQNKFEKHAGVEAHLRHYYSSCGVVSHNQEDLSGYPHNNEHWILKCSVKNSNEYETLIVNERFYGYKIKNNLHLGYIRGAVLHKHLLFVLDVDGKLQVFDVNADKELDYTRYPNLDNFRKDTRFMEISSKYATGLMSLVTENGENYKIYAGLVFDENWPNSEKLRMTIEKDGPSIENIKP